MGDLFGSDPLPSADPRSVLHVALDQLRQVLEARDRLDELVEGLEYYLQAQIENHNITECPIGRYGPGRPAPPMARRLRIVRHPDGSATVYIDAEKPFRLPRGLADFLEHLASDEGVSSDTLVAWKSRASLREWFQQQSGKEMCAKYVNKRVHDLRRHMQDAGIKRHLIHTHNMKGVRFALLRGPARGRWRVVASGGGDRG